MSATPSNRLINETSPYLLQHAHNPVDWYPWGEEALERARREDKPILLSIGYSACHWCHVMEHESFEDEEVARLMNELFVCIKLDREERPDLDKIYQTAHQILTGRPGGWPLNMFLTPDEHLPFFGGTYFPKTPRYGMAGFPEILREIAAVYRGKRDVIREQNVQLIDVFRRIAPAEPAPGQQPTPALLDEGYDELRQQFDPANGGFGGAPKFPHPTSLEFLLRHAARGAAHADEALQMTLTTLTRMAEGGLYDHVGGGFARYSVDERWEIPHFEKMLYDNGPLLTLYADAALVTGDSSYRRVAVDTGEWVMREMQSPEGGYYSTLDADSEGHEGKYYVWSTDELKRILTPDEYAAVALRYGLTGEPNFEGKWHLNARAELAVVATRLKITEDDAARRLASARGKLFAEREKRVRPARDEKILASWNGLMVKGMVRAGRLLGRPDFVDSAERAFDFIRVKMWIEQRLRATYKDGRARFDAYLDDYAFLLEGAIELLQARWRAETLDFALALAHTLIEHFEDENRGGFYFTADDHERLAYRPKTTVDEAVPNGNGVAARALLQLGHLLGDLNLVHAAERTIEGLHADAARRPSACCALLIAVEEYLSPPQTVVIRGAANALPAWQDRLRSHYSARRLSFAVPDDAPVSGLLKERKNIATVTAYLCEGRSCQAPITDVRHLEQTLRTKQ
jgi:uncharacterized protein